MPKLPVERAWVGSSGLEGDRQRHQTVHGGPQRAVALLAIEAIERVQADGHPIEPGSTGENLTTSGIELASLPVGTRLEVGDRLVLEIAGAANPCNLIADSFRGGKSGRLSILTHPLDSRMYARTLVAGEVRPGDPIRVLAPSPDSQAKTHVLLDLLESVEREAWLTLWRAGAAAGYRIDIIDDGDLAAAASAELPGSLFNRAFGMRTLPSMLPRICDHFRAAGSPGWAVAAEPPAAGAIGEEPHALFFAPIAEMLSAPVVPSLEIRTVGPDDATRWGHLAAEASGLTQPLRAAWPELAPGLVAGRSERLFVAELDGRPVATAAIFMRRRVGWLGAAAVMPEARGRGIQRALIAGRAALANELGCTMVMATADTPSVSATNLEAMGLRAVWDRQLYRLDLST